MPEIVRFAIPVSPYRNPGSFDRKPLESPHRSRKRPAPRRAGPKAGRLREHAAGPTCAPPGSSAWPPRSRTTPDARPRTPPPTHAATGAPPWRPRPSPASSPPPPAGLEPHRRLRRPPGPAPVHPREHLARRRPGPPPDQPRRRRHPRAPGRLRRGGAPPQLRHPRSAVPVDGYASTLRVHAAPGRGPFPSPFRRPRGDRRRTPQGRGPTATSRHGSPTRPAAPPRGRHTPVHAVQPERHARARRAVSDGTPAAVPRRPVPRAGSVPPTCRWPRPVRSGSAPVSGGRASTSWPCRTVPSPRGRRPTGRRWRRRARRRPCQDLPA